MNTAVVHSADCLASVQAVRPFWYTLQQQGLLILSSPTSGENNLSRYDAWRQLYLRAEREFLRLNRPCEQVLFIWQRPVSDPDTLTEEGSLSWQLDAFIRIVREGRQQEPPAIRALIMNHCNAQQSSFISHFDRHGFLDHEHERLPFLFTRNDFYNLDQKWIEKTGSSILQINKDDKFHDLAQDQRNLIETAIEAIKNESSQLIGNKKTAANKFGAGGLFAQICDGTIYDNLNQLMAKKLQSLTTADNLIPLTGFKPSKVYTDFLKERLSIHRQYHNVQMEIIHFTLTGQLGQDAASLAAAVIHLINLSVEKITARRPDVPEKQINIDIAQPEILCQDIRIYCRRLEQAAADLSKRLKNPEEIKIHLLQVPLATSSNDKDNSQTENWQPDNSCSGRSLDSWLMWVTKIKNSLNQEVMAKAKTISNITNRLLAEESRTENCTINDFTAEIERRERELEQLRKELNLPPFPRHNWPAIISEQDETIRKLLAVRPRRPMMLTTLLVSTVIFLLPWLAAQSVGQGIIAEHFFVHEHYIYPVSVLAVHGIITAFLLWRDHHQQGKQLLKADKKATNQWSKLAKMYKDYLKALTVIHQQGTMEANIALLRRAETISKQRQKAIHRQQQWLQEHLEIARKLLQSLQIKNTAADKYNDQLDVDYLETTSPIENPELLPYQLPIYHFPINPDGSGIIAGITESTFEEINQRVF